MCHERVGQSALVARTGFEPVISALRGLHPRPLDERAVGFHCTERDLSRSPRALSDLVAPGIRRIPIPLPIRGLSIVNAYLVEGAHGWSLVDAGLHTVEAEQALRGGLADAGIGEPAAKRLFGLDRMQASVDEAPTVRSLDEVRVDDRKTADRERDGDAPDARRDKIAQRTRGPREVTLGTMEAHGPF